MCYFLTGETRNAEKKGFNMKKDSGKLFKSLLAVSMAVTPALGALQPVIATSPAREQAARDAVDYRAFTSPVLKTYSTADDAQMYSLSMASRLVIAADEQTASNERLMEVVRLANARLQDKGIISSQLPMILGVPGMGVTGDVIFRLADTITEETDSKEAYKIEIKDGVVTITGASENALLLAVSTLEQLANVEGGFPEGTIVDWPDLGERRIHVDCARKYISKDWFIRQIHEMAYLKVNTLQMHFSENLGFRIECETDPAIVSEEHLTKAEVREILEEARLYGIKVIPSFDSPGHVDQILKAHPEYGQVSSTGSHLTSGLDITNPEAIAYIRSLYDEYMELFEGCTDFHIGGDEYMEFDRAPFTTQYQSVLNAYAQTKYGADYTWRDVVAGYVNELAEYVHDHGFNPRIFNDGIYYGENYSWQGTPQKIVMHDYIGIDFWSQMSWNSNIATLSTILNHGHDKLYNMNASFFYYVLRPTAPTDGRLQHSFDNLNPDKLIYNDWTPGKFQGNTISDDSPVIQGSSIAVWCDKSDVADEDTIHEDIENPLRAMASKAWNVQSPSITSWENFSANFENLGHAAAYEKGSKLTLSGDFTPEGDLGSIRIHYVDDKGNTLKADDVRYGKTGDAFTFEAPAIYGYRVKENGTLNGTFTEEAGEYTIVYEKYTDFAALQAEVSAAPAKASILPGTWAAYEEALNAAKAVLADPEAGQKDVDDALKALQAAKELTVPAASYVLYGELSYPLPSASYASGYEEYTAAVNAAKATLQTPGEEQAAAMEAVAAAAANLVKKTDNTPSVEATHNYYEESSYNKTKYSYDKMFDGDLSTKCWFGQPQTADAEVVMTFASPVLLSSIAVNQPDSDDYIRAADVQVKVNGEWQTVGSITGREEIVKTFTFDEVRTSQVRLVLTETSDRYWYQINEISFGIRNEEEDSTLKDLVIDAAKTSLDGVSYEKMAAFTNAYLAARKAISDQKEDPSEEISALQAALAALSDSPVTVNKQLLKDAIDYALPIPDGDAYVNVHPLVKTRFEAALARAQEVYAKASATQQEVNTAWTDLTSAIHMLDFKADKSGLLELIARADAVDLDQISDGELKDAFIAALEHAHDVADSETALDASIIEAAAALDNALTALENMPVASNKTLLKAAIEYALPIPDSESYIHVHPLVKDRFEAALAKAQEVYADPSATQQEVNEAWMELTSAIHMLDFTADKTALLDVIARAETIDLSQYQDGAEKEAFIAALAHAKEVAESETSLDPSIAQAAQNLEAAMAALVPVPSDLDLWALTFLVNELKDLDLSLYANPDAEKQAYTDAYSHAAEVLANPQSQEAVDTAAEALNNAYLSLRLKPSEEMLETIRNFVSQAEALHAEDYSKATWNQIQAVVKEAKDGLNNPNLDRYQAAVLIKKISNAQSLIDSKDGTANSSSRSAQSVKTSAATGAAALFGAMGAALAGLLASKRRKK